MKTVVIILLVIIAIAMIYIGVNKDMLPPSLTGIGFILIALLFAKK